MKPLKRAFTFVLALLFVAGVLAPALGDTAVRESDIRNADGSYTHVREVTDKDFVSTTVTTSRVTRQGAATNSPVTKVEDSKVVDIGGGIKSITSDTLEYNVDGSVTATNKDTEINPDQTTETTQTRVGNPPNWSRGSKTVKTTKKGLSPTYQYFSWDAAKQDWVASAAPPLQTGQAPAHHNNSVLAGVLGALALVAIFSAHGNASNQSQQTTQQGGAAIAFAPSSISACKSASSVPDSVSESGYNGMFAVQSSNANVVALGSSTTTGTIDDTFVNPGTATITARDSMGHQAIQQVTVNNC
jgi:hypothetical protein